MYLVAPASDEPVQFPTPAFVSLATVANAHAQPGTELTVLWGEAPNSRKPTVEPHAQVEIRATVAPAPLGSFARSGYRSA
jgi:hypothetical protein